MDDTREQLNIRGLTAVLRRRAKLILVCALLVPAGALLVSLLQEEEYTASASLLFRDPALDQKLFGSTFFDPATDSDREAATNSELLSLDVVAERTANRLSNGMSAEAVSERVEAKPDPSADLIEVTATDPSPQLAAALANTFADQYVAFRQRADRAKVRQAERLINREVETLSAAGADDSELRALEKNSRRLDVLAALQTGNAELVQPAETPSSPSSPKPLRNAGLGLVLGVLLGIALAFLRERLDRRLRDQREVEEAFGRPILGAIPTSRFLSESNWREETFAAEDADAFRMIRANLRYFNVDEEIRSILVTSAVPGEGKSTVAWNLAAVAAAAGSRVIVVEADLRHPRFMARVKAPPNLGLSAYLAGVVPLTDVVRRVAVEDRSNGQAPRRWLYTILAGPVPPNPSELIESDRMRELIKLLEKNYDMVVIDTPPTSVVSDAVPLIKQAEGVVVVSRLGTSTRDATVRLRDQLANLDAPTLGVVINAVGQPAAYGYGYGYGYGTSRRKMWRLQPDGRSHPGTTSERPTPAARSSSMRPREARQTPPDRQATSSSAAPSRSASRTLRWRGTERPPPPSGGN